MFLKIMTNLFNLFAMTILALLFMLLFTLGVSAGSVFCEGADLSFLAELR